MRGHCHRVLSLFEACLIPLMKECRLDATVIEIIQFVEACASKSVAWVLKIPGDFGCVIPSNSSSSGQRSVFVVQVRDSLS